MEELANNKNVIIRNAEIRDAAQAIYIVKQVMAEAPFFPRASEEFVFTVEQEESYIKNAALFLVVEVEGKIVGLATLDRSNLVKIHHTATFGINILKEYCGQGVGSLLMQRVIEWAENNGVEKIDLEVFANNISAIALYKKYGFVEEGRKRKAIKTNEGYQDMLIMVRL
ncbi:GNAT family N-acetyltransferase [Inconstantimicrobium mannanitabidum]|uniref:N-acetyltransferase n=1 Tax=Inconstantimicrobium mannanitabidum TaxID=1604901 RepID=A0ACB5RFW3_9CLOT|nr:GNAT family N-acetyltransferase [Clostridium sp. TW13]GKX67970.1 N-acetyltransferase [Clostridium sp. TW13]